MNCALFIFIYFLYCGHDASCPYIDRLCENGGRLSYGGQTQGLPLHIITNYNKLLFRDGTYVYILLAYYVSCFNLVTVDKLPGG